VDAWDQDEPPSLTTQMLVSTAGVLSAVASARQKALFDRSLDHSRVIGAFDRSLGFPEHSSLRQQGYVRICVRAQMCVRACLRALPCVSVILCVYVHACMRERERGGGREGENVCVRVCVYTHTHTHMRARTYTHTHKPAATFLIARLSKTATSAFGKHSKTVCSE
jgi:hypothetical protein